MVENHNNNKEYNICTMVSGTRSGKIFVLYNHQFCGIRQHETAHFFYNNNKLNDLIIRSLINKQVTFYESLQLV